MSLVQEASVWALVKAITLNTEPTWNICNLSSAQLFSILFLCCTKLSLANIKFFSWQKVQYDLTQYTKLLIQKFSSLMKKTRIYLAYKCSHNSYLIWDGWKTVLLSVNPLSHRKDLVALKYFNKKENILVKDEGELFAYSSLMLLKCIFLRLYFIIKLYKDNCILKRLKGF